MTWQIHPAAQQEHDDCIEYYAGIDPEIASSFELRYLQARNEICGNPFLHNIRRRSVRRVNLQPRFGDYYVAYTVWREQVVILAVAHAKRRPYYWRKRITEARKLF
jgi:plasmid stabilization system protein ParE